jgi:hypothetical protein
MKSAGLLFFVAVAAFGQATADNAAGDSLKKRLEGINLFSAPKPVAVRVVRTAETKGICAAIVVTAPQPTNDSMPVTRGTGVENPGDMVTQVPAPACGK